MGACIIHKPLWRAVTLGCPRRAAGSPPRLFCLSCRPALLSGEHSPASLLGVRLTWIPSGAEVTCDPGPGHEGAKDTGLRYCQGKGDGQPFLLVKKPRSGVPGGRASPVTLPVTLHGVPSCQSHRRRHRSTSGPGSAYTRLPAIARHYGPRLQSFDAHRTGSASKRVCDRTPLGETEAKQEEEVEGKCFRVPQLRLRHLSYTSLSPPFPSWKHCTVRMRTLACPLVQAPFGVSVPILGVGEVDVV